MSDVIQMYMYIYTLYIVHEKGHGGVRQASDPWIAVLNLLTLFICVHVHVIVYLTAHA